MPQPRYYTVNEANAEVPRLRETLERIRRSRGMVIGAGERIRKEATSNGGGREGAAYWEALRTLREDVQGLAAAGIVLRDADAGLVDFPSRRQGREVFLCWRLDEDRVGFWHEVDSGFGARKPLAEH